MISFNGEQTFSYEMIGEFRSDEPWIHPRRIINSTEVILVLEGEVHIAEEETEYSLKKDDVIILSPEKEHYGFKTSFGTTAFYWFHFHTDLPLPFKALTGADVFEIKKQLKRLLHFTNTPSYSGNSADALAFLVFEELSQIGFKETSSNSGLVSRIKEFVRGNLLRNPTVADISENFGYNPDYIGKLFKNTVGVGLKEYIAAERLKYAKDLLLTTSKTVKQIAFDLGFAAENLFIKFFGYHEGISPTAYRSKYYNTHINNR